MTERTDALRRLVVAARTFSKCLASHEDEILNAMTMDDATAWDDLDAALPDAAKALEDL